MTPLSSSVSAVGAPDNPFATRYIRPRALPWLGGDLESIRARWTHDVMQVVGPHGSGKTTLLHLVAPHATFVRAPIAPRPGQHLVLDAGELYAPRRIMALGRRVSAARGRLLLTTHRDLGLPTLATLATDVRLARAVVEHLLRERAFPRPSDEALEAMLLRRSGNLREVLLDLYDDYEAWYFAVTAARSGAPPRSTSRPR